MTQLFMTLPDLASADLTSPLPAGLSIRSARGSDSEGLASVLAVAFQEDWDVERVRRELFEADDVVAAHVLTDESGNVLGTACERIAAQWPGAGYVHWVAVDPTASRRRLGAALTCEVLRGFRDRGLPRAVLETDDFRVPAVVTYLRLGFVPSVRRDVEETAWSALLPTLIGRRS